MSSDSGAPARLNLPGMLDMSLSMPIFTTRGSVGSPNGHARVWDEI